MQQNSFGLTFNVQNYSLVNQVEYVYMLKGLENSWYTVNENNSVTFRNIPPGKYEFLIKARVHNQEWPGRSYFTYHPCQSPSLADMVGKAYLYFGIYQHHLSYPACI